MKKISNKGFTLVELLAMLTVLAILMVVTVPNISGILQNSKMNSIKADARKMVSETKIQTAKSKNDRPNVNECIVYSLNSINISDDLNKGPNGGDYNQFDSFVVYTRIGNQYKYYVRLIEEKDGKQYGIELANIDDIKDKDNSNIKKITSTPIGLSKDATDNDTKVSTYLQSKSICNNATYIVGNTKTESDIMGS